MKKTKYFGHEAYHRHQPAIRALIKEYGMVGYGQFWTILEILREQPDYHVDLSKEYWLEYLQCELQLDQEGLNKYLDACVKKYGVLRSEGEFLSNDDLMENMSLMTELSEKRKEAAERRWHPDSGPITGGDANAKQMHGKEIKQKEIKGKEIKLKDTKQHETVPTIGSLSDRAPIPEKEPGIDPLDSTTYPEEAETAFFHGEGFYVPLELAERLCRLYGIDKAKLKIILSGTDGDCPPARVSLTDDRDYETYEDYVRDYVEKAMDCERREPSIDEWEIYSPTLTTSIMGSDEK